MGSLKRELERSVPELRERYLEREMAVPAGLLEALDADARNGARELARRIRERRQKNRSEGQRLRNLLKYEHELYEQGHVFIAGVDEAGMAPLAGPVIAAAVIMPKDYKLRGLDDSKKIVDEQRREELAKHIRRDALAWGTGRAEVEEIDTINIYHAGLLAMSRALAAMCEQKCPDFVLVDARKIPNCSYPQRGIIHGDALSISIAAASIIAKTTRDALMCEYDKQYPGYGLADHKGYPTPRHCKKLVELGATPLHRKSFNRVRAVLGLAPMQMELISQLEDGGESEERA